MPQTDIEYDDEEKQLAWEAYLEGYDLGKSVESLSVQRINTAKSFFERWWDRNHSS